MSDQAGRSYARSDLRVVRAVLGERGRRQAAGPRSSPAGGARRPAPAPARPPARVRARGTKRSSAWRSLGLGFLAGLFRACPGLRDFSSKTH